MPDAVQLVIAGLQQRLQLALDGFDKLNEHRDPCQVAAYGPPLGWQQATSISGLVNLLTAKGLITEQEFVICTLTEQIALLESVLAGSAEHLRQVTGLIVPLGSAGRPQG